MMINRYVPLGEYVSRFPDARRAASIAQATMANSVLIVCLGNRNAHLSIPQRTSFFSDRGKHDISSLIIAS